MKNPTRRSFIKKSTAAALVAANVTVFSGLINASEGGGGTGTGTGGTTGWFTTGSGTGGTTGSVACATQTVIGKQKYWGDDGDLWCADVVKCYTSSGALQGTYRWDISAEKCIASDLGQGGSCSGSVSTGNSLHPFCWA